MSKISAVIIIFVSILLILSSFRNASNVTKIDQYQQLYNLCELKYQTGIDGDMQKAFEIKGQMQSILDQIEK